MRKNTLFAIVILATSLTAVLFYIDHSSSNIKRDGLRPERKRLAENNANLENFVKVSLNGHEYSLAWVEINNLDNLTIHSNIQNSFSSKEAIEKFNCRTITSAGFYSTEDTHLGLLIENGEVISDSKESLLLNGYFYYDDGATITTSPPEEAKYAVQSGPLLILDKEIVKSQVVNNEEARRLIVATTEKDTVLLIAIYGSNSQFKGPRLSQTASLLKKFEENIDTTIIDALNLDGGSASLFVSDGITLREVTKSGGFFCVKE